MTIKDTETFIGQAQKVHDNFYSYDNLVYVSYSDRVEITCPIHGSFYQIPSSHLQGHGCKKCGVIKAAKTQSKECEFFIKEASNAHNGKYSYEHLIYKSSHKKIKITCPIHGVFEQTPASHLQGHGCPKCHYEKNKANQPLSIEDFIKNARKVHGDIYSYELVKYINSKVKVKIVCPFHGVFEQTPDIHCNGGCRCPKCSNSVSKQEVELQEWVSSITDIITNSRKLIHPYELDIVIPSHNIAIEYNGLYWHSEEAGKDKKYHLNKYNLCKDKGYRLIQIWENEWMLKKDIVKSIIMSALGIYERKIHGRKCEVYDVASKDAKIFYDANHIQGFKGGAHKGLMCEGELVSLMTIDKRGELHRFANKKFHKIHGAFSKILKSYNLTGDITTFADIRYFTGNVYEKNGFCYESDVIPSYWYFMNHTLDVTHRRGFQKKHIERKFNQGILNFFDTNLTEYDNMKVNGFFKIWDCGKIKYIKKG